MDKAQIKGLVTKIQNVTAEMEPEQLTAVFAAMREELKTRNITTTTNGKRGRPAIYASAQERCQAYEAKRKALIEERNASLIASGLPVPRRGRPTKNTLIVKPIPMVQVSEI